MSPSMAILWTSVLSSERWTGKAELLITRVS
jgi:hypothetical protein